MSAARRIKEYFSDLFAAYGSGEYARGLAIARAAHGECHDEHAKTWFWQACMHSLMGDTEEAMAALRKGLDEGVWWSPRMLDGEPDLDQLRDTPGFMAVREECGQRWNRAQSVSRPECLVIAPPTVPWASRSLFLIHWRGDTASGFSTYWRPLVDEGWTLIVPQSSQVHDSASFCWDDTESALAELRQHLDDCRRKRGLVPSEMVFAGASQGARLALELAHENGSPWLCIIPSFPTGYDASPIAAVPSHVSGAFLLGELDHSNTRARPIISALESAGAPIITRIMKGVGHDFPEDFAALAREVLAALRGQAGPP
jgi:predicted esterase